MPIFELGLQLSQLFPNFIGIESHVFLYVYIPIKQEENNAQQETVDVSFKFQSYLSNLCLPYTNVHFFILCNLQFWFISRNIL